MAAMDGGAAADGPRAGPAEEGAAAIASVCLPSPSSESADDAEMSEEEPPDFREPFRFAAPSMEGYKPIHRVTLHVRRCAYDEFLTHDGGGRLFEKVWTVGADGPRETSAWKFKCTVQDYVYAKCDPRQYHDQWRDLMECAVSKVVQHLTLGHHFPPLVRCRSAFAFRDGVLRVKRDRLHFGPALHIHAVRFFDVDFAPLWAEFLRTGDFPTPTLDAVMQHQGYVHPAHPVHPVHCPQRMDTLDWLKILIGRMVFDVGTRDGWQVLPFLLGRAWTGKSTIAKMVSRLYDADDVGILANNIEPQFGFSTVAGKLIFVGPEIRENLRLDQSEFQSAVSGKEPMKLAVKHKDPLDLQQWTAAGFLAGNHLPKFSNEGGSMSRRLCIFPMNTPIVHADTSIDVRLEAEIPALLGAGVSRYLRVVRDSHHAGFWELVHPFFSEQRTEVEATVDSLAAFFSGDALRFGGALFMPMQLLKELYNRWCETNNQERLPWNASHYGAVFATKGVHEEKDTRRKYNGRVAHQRLNWAVGCDCAE